METPQNKQNQTQTQNVPAAAAQVRPQPAQKERRGGLTAGLILISLGAIFLISNFIPELGIGKLWPLLLVVIGFILITKSFSRRS